MKLKQAEVTTPDTKGMLEMPARMLEMPARMQCLVPKVVHQEEEPMLSIQWKGRTLARSNSESPQPVRSPLRHSTHLQQSISPVLPVGSSPLLQGISPGLQRSFSRVHDSKVAPDSIQEESRREFVVRNEGIKPFEEGERAMNMPLASKDARASIESPRKKKAHQVVEIQLPLRRRKLS